MPSDAFIRSFKKKYTTAELIERRGAFLPLGRATAFAKKWHQIIEAPGMPARSSAIVVLTGKRNRDLNDLGCCIRGSEGRENFGVIFLDDPDPGSMKHAETGILRFHLPGLFNPAFTKRVWQAYLTKVFVHELGHARFFQAHGGKGTEAKQEQASEKLAWSTLYELFDREVVLAAYSLFWLLAAINDD